MLRNASVSSKQNGGRDRCAVSKPQEDRKEVQQCPKAGKAASLPLPLPAHCLMLLIREVGSPTQWECVPPQAKGQSNEIPALRTGAASQPALPWKRSANERGRENARQKGKAKSINERMKNDQTEGKGQQHHHPPTQK